IPTPSTEARSPVPRSVRRPPERSSATDLLHLRPRPVGGVVHHPVEAGPQRDAEERDDEHRDGGGADPLTTLVVPWRTSLSDAHGHLRGRVRFASARGHEPPVTCDIAAENGTARKMSPGTSVATVTGIQTSW